MAATDVIRRWRTDLGEYARHHLKVLTKGGSLEPLLLNAAQAKLMEICDQLREETGRVRVIIVKGRQLGISTVIAARFVRDAMLKPGTRVSVIAHRKDATSNLAEMTRRFYDQAPEAGKIPLVKRNDTELIFSHQSSYTLSTAGQAASPEATGRSRTATRLHASEYAFWVGAGDRMAGLGQALADQVGTEGFVESTAQGQANALYDLWRLALAGTTDWRPVFLPWFIEPAYSRPPPKGFFLHEEPETDFVLSEVDYREAYDLTLAQMYWRRLKIAELSLGQGSGMLRWCQEYPATAEEAFISTTETAYLNAHHIADARARYVDLVAVSSAPLVVGIDPATSHGADATVFIRRRRMKAYGLTEHYRIAPDQIVAMAWTIWTEERPEMFVVDRSEGVGDHVFTALATRGVPITGVYFGGRATLPSRYYDRRAELYARIAAWLPEADIPDDEDLAVDLIAQMAEPLENRQLRLVNKHKLKGFGHRSPDRSDALACTMAYIDPEQSSLPAFDTPVDVFRDIPREVAVR